MDMNFPHKDLDLSAMDADADLVSDLESLITCAVRRQSDSITSRAMATGRDPVAGIRTDVPEAQREERIKFFAGESRSQGAKENGDRIFATGHFRPDLVDGDSAG
ncbi:MAG: hypothetical protein AAGM33_12540 [Pseudomonadota bacterium]